MKFRRMVHWFSWLKRWVTERAAEILETTLDEEKETDENLTQLAENGINWEASEEEEEED